MPTVPPMPATTMPAAGHAFPAAAGGPEGITAASTDPDPRKSIKGCVVVTR